MGTELFARGIAADQCLDAINLSEPNVVQQIHRDYIAAGAELLETTTYGANRFRLQPFGLAERARDINRQGARLAREAREIMGESVFVAGSIGPSGAPFPPLGQVSYAEVGQALAEQAEVLAEAGVDLLVFETFTNLSELLAAIGATRKVCDLPIVAQASYDDTVQTASGDRLEEVAAALERLGVAVVGANCGIGPQQALGIAERLGANGRLVSVQPNAGYPVRVRGRVAYLATPDYFATFAREAVARGARLIGGCCGTRPAHVAAMRQALRPDPAPVVVAAPARPRPVPPPPADASEPKTRLAQKLERGEFVVSVELDPPKGSNPGKALRGAQALKEAGADLINIGDSPMAKVRMSALGLALLIQRDVGLETLIHFTSRDRNLMAIQSDLLGAHALGIRHVIALTGDQLRSSAGSRITSVWDVDSIGLVGIVKRMNEGFDAAGTSIGRPTSFLVACAVSPNADDVDHELDRFRQKIDAGADFAMSQPLFSMEQLETFHERLGGEPPIPHVLGIVPLESYRQAEFLHHEVPGFSIPTEIRERLRQAGDHGAEEGLRIASEFVAEARRHVAGVYIITSYGRYDAAISLTKQLVGEPVASAP
jgi:homocysteine S-methyltransferase